MRRKNQVPSPSSPTRFMIWEEDAKKLRRVQFELAQNHGVTVSASFILHHLMKASTKDLIAELAGAAK